MSLELEQIIKQSLDGKFFAITDDGKTVKRLVDADYMPDHHRRYAEACRTTGAMNASYKPWSPELDAKLIAARSSGLSWVAVGSAIGRSPIRCTERYKELCRTLGLMPAPNKHWTSMQKARG